MGVQVWTRRARAARWAGHVGWAAAILGTALGAHVLLRTSQRGLPTPSETGATAERWPPALANVPGDALGRAPGRHMRPLGRFHPSFYQTVEETDPAFRGERHHIRVQDRAGRTLAHVTRSFHRRMCAEGAGRLADGRVLTFDARVRGEIRFRLTDAPYGLSHGAAPLVPFRSAAVDRSVIPLGSTLYVPAFAGVRLPDGTVHNGLFAAHDVGSAIRGRNMDFFVGVEDHLDNRLLEAWRKQQFRPVDVYLVPKELKHALLKAYGADEATDPHGHRR